MSNAEVTTPDQELADFLSHADFGEFQVPFEASLQFPEIQYMKNVTILSANGDEDEYTGWCIHTGQSAELDALLAQLGAVPVRIQHYFTKSVENYWQLNTVKGAILCRSVPSVGAYDQSPQTGIPYVWNAHLDKSGKVIGSQLQALFFLNGLMESGYRQPLVISMSRTITEYFVSNVLQKQSGLIELVKSSLRKQGRPDGLSFYALWVELAVGDKKTPAKHGKVYPPIVLMPSPMTGEYLRTHKVPEKYKEIIESFVPSLDAWTKATSERLVTPRDNEPAVVEEVPEHNGYAGSEATKGVQEVLDETIKTSGPYAKALYASVVQNRKIAMKEGLIQDASGWQWLLDYVGIEVFKDRSDVAKLNTCIVDLIKDKANQNKVS